MDDSAPKRRRTSPRTSVEVRPEPNTESEAPNNSAPAAPAVPPVEAPSLTNPKIASPARQTTTVPNNAPKSNEEKARTTEQEHQENAPNSEAPNTITRRLSERLKQSVPPKPLSPHAAIAKAFRGRTLRRSGTGLTVTDNIIEQHVEPELPPLSSPLGRNDPMLTMEMSGLHNLSSSPSALRKKRRQASKGASQASRLSNVQSQTDDDVSITEPTTTTDLSKSQDGAKNGVPPTRSKKEMAKREYSAKLAGAGSRGKWSALGTKSQRDVQKTIDPARGIEQRDQYWEKRELIAKLKEEVAVLESDLEFAKSENDRIRGEVLNQATAKLGGAVDTEHVMKLLKTHILPAEKQKLPAISQQMLSIALNPMSWLPFGNVSTLPPLSSTAAKDEPEVKSHLPIKMSAEEEKPFLQLFTPFSYNSKTVMLEQKNSYDPLLIQHIMEVIPTTNPGSFSAQIEVTVDAQKLVITNLAIPSLDIRAQAELGPFLNEVIENPRNRALKNNICVVSWAMADWYRIASQRATFWCTLSKELGSADSIRELTKKMRTQKRARGNANDEEDEAVDMPQLVDFMACMGRTALEVPLALGRDAVMQVRIQWDIKFDWTGEAVSSTALLVGVPGKWQKADKRGTLPQVSKLFNDLVIGDNDMLKASRTMVALLAGQNV
ncbi:hypothetical protein TD95_004620 [Thielaviopsis punctulata]|uniref:Uncharacterized protein n=1 Tax=Thielaviopsis punctulata TaxID=72032 RepID=A0A0F4ZKD5_9PEZI|nr:hypothetical protein TD95_004620 [Thielaviopsis punctulata]